MITRYLVNLIVRFLASVILKIDKSELDKVPRTGPLLVVVNHINSLDAPVIISLMYPRPTTGLVKKETWDNAFLRFLFNVWEGIPIDREIADFTAFRAAQEALKSGKILAVAPEGTRTRDGHLIQAKPGIAMLAMKAGVPILPVVYYGHETFPANLKKLRRTPMAIRVGEPFQLDLSGHAREKSILQEVADEIMIEIARLLPEEYRGYYTDRVNGSQEFIEHLSGSTRQHISQAFG
jgi:1-acyl-sn-glycerol-3-phosphate acyltransferase